MAAFDPTVINRVASLLIVLAMTRAASDRLRANLWSFSLYALLATTVAVGALFLLRQEFQLPVLLVSVAIEAGVYWTALSRPHAHQTAREHGASLGAALALTVVVALLAMFYQWWVGPLVLLGLVVAGAALNLVLPFSPQRAARATPAAEPARPGSMANLPKARPQASPAPQSTAVAIRCKSCGLQGVVAASQRGKTLACPRCRAPVQVPLQAARP